MWSVKGPLRQVTRKTHPGGHSMGVIHAILYMLSNTVQYADHTVLYADHIVPHADNTVLYAGHTVLYADHTVL